MHTTIEELRAGQVVELFPGSPQTILTDATPAGDGDWPVTMLDWDHELRVQRLPAGTLYGLVTEEPQQLAC